MSSAIRGVQAAIDERIADLQSGSSTLLSRFPRESSVYAQIETLGASTNLDELKAKANSDPKVDEEFETLRRAVAALEGDTIRTQITFRQREKRSLEQASEMANGLLEFDSPRYNELLAKRAQLTADHDTFRSELFAAAGLPAAPEETWSAFIEAGEAYRTHLVAAPLTHLRVQSDSRVHPGMRCFAPSTYVPSRTTNASACAFWLENAHADAFGGWRLASTMPTAAYIAGRHSTPRRGTCSLSTRPISKTGSAANSGR